MFNLSSTRIPISVGTTSVAMIPRLKVVAIMLVLYGEELQLFFLCALEPEIDS